MKQYLFLMLLIAGLNPLLSQSLLTENFTSTVFPPSGWTIDVQDTNWSRSYSNAAGGEATGEANLYFYPQFNGTTRFISPAINLSGISTVALSFRHRLDWDINSVVIGVATRTGTSGTWTTVWLATATADIAASSVDVLINNANTSQSNFQFCIFFSGDSYNINNYYIDDILLFVPEALDGKMNALTVNPYNEQGNISITGSVKNNGQNSISSFSVNYSLDGGVVHTTPVAGQSLAFGDTYDFSCAQVWNATAGNYELKSWISDVNSATDLENSNDSLSMEVSIATQSTEMTPLFEEFTSSTCSPCASYNSSLFDPWFDSHSGFSLIKYQMNWPGTGDIYYTTDGGVRRYYYEISGVPSLLCQGKKFYISQTGIDTTFANAQATPAFFAIEATATHSGWTVFVSATITPYITGLFNVFGVVVEKTTTGNVGSNGETSFKNVMMDIVPVASGLPLDFKADSSIIQTFAFDMGSTHVEEMNDLQAIIFIQKYGSRQVMQSFKTDISVGMEETKTGITVYPNPANNQLFVQAESFSFGATYIVVNTLGEIMMQGIITSENTGTPIGINTTDLVSGYYLLQISDNNNTGVTGFIKE